MGRYSPSSKYPESVCCIIKNIGGIVYNRNSLKNDGGTKYQIGLDMVWRTNHLVSHLSLFACFS